MMTILIHEEDEMGIFQASDLSRKRRELLEAARAGMARVRDTDGTSLVMLPEDQYELGKRLADWGRFLLTGMTAMQKPREERTVFDFGELAWLDVFDEDDLGSFFEDAINVFMIASAQRDILPLDLLEHEWRETARALSDERRRNVLVGPVRRKDFVEAARPTE